MANVFKKAGRYLKENGLEILGAGMTGGVPGVVGTVLGSLGLDDKSTDDDVEAALAGADLVELRRIESEERVKIVEAELHTTRHELEKVLLDKQSARQMYTQTRDNTPKVLTIFICSVWVLTAIGVFFVDIPAENRELVIRFQGSMDGSIATAIAFWLGSSFGSKLKGDTIDAALKSDKQE